MPTSLGAVMFYVFALFPGMAFFFAREGHRPPVRQSILRETGAIVLVSALCDGVLALLLAAVAWVNNDFRLWLLQLINGDMTWARMNPLGATAAVLGAVVAVTLLGRLLGSEWADNRGLHRFWRAWIPRSMTAWGIYLDTKQQLWLKGPHHVRVEILLRSGRRVRGIVDSFENDTAQGSESALTLCSPITVAQPGSADFVAAEGSVFMMLRQVDIESISVSYEPAPGQEDGPRSRRSRKQSK